MNFPTGFMGRNIIKHVLTLLTTLFAVSCAYFNTFYNAEQYFIKAEKIRLENAGESLPSTAVEAYNKVIEKCNKVIVEYPESTYHDAAYMLLGKARFYKKEYKTAEGIFRQISQGNDETFAREASYWLSLIKWKFGKIQPAINDLDRFIETSSSRTEKSSAYLSLADIYLEIQEDRQAFESLENAANFSSNDSEKGQIYYRISHLAYDKGDLDRALKAFRNVIKFSLSKTHVEEANLMVVRLYREMGELENASDRIRIMLLDDSFNKIHADLELELAKLYMEQDEWEQALTRLASITESYQKTAASAEAYFHLGEHELYNRWNLEEAKKYYGNVKKEHRKSDKGIQADIKLKEITSYLASNEEFQSNYMLWKTAYIDTVELDSSDAEILPEETLKERITAELISMSELEAFHLSNVDSAISHLEKIIEMFPESDVHPRALFTQAYLYSKKNELEKVTGLEEEILELYPNSDFADFVRKKNNIESVKSSSANMLLEAESLRLLAREEAITRYHQIVENDSTSESSLIAGYFLAHHYDRIDIDPEKALNHYSWVTRLYPESDQARESTPRISFLSTYLRQSDKNVDDEDDSVVIESESKEIIEEESSDDVSKESVQAKELPIKEDTRNEIPPDKEIDP